MRPKKKKLAEIKPFPIVGIGASAGGLEAIEGFFTNMPPDSGMAFVIVQHLDPKRKSIMGSLLEKYTKMKVIEAKDGMKIEPNRIYLNPPDREVGIIDRTFQLVKPAEGRGLRLPIDFFLRSLALDLKEKAICIIMSGTGTDGTLGLKAIKGEGGIAIVQEERQAKYAGMPASAIETGLVDFILPVEKISSELLKYVKHPYVEGKPVPLTVSEQYKNYLSKIFMLIRSTTGHDFSNYKQTTIRRRIERRMALHQINRLEEYFNYLQRNKAEVETMAKDMLIGVTSFFRDPDAFEFLKEKVIPRLLHKRPADLPLRIWVAGCATGEEAYSIAMVVAECLDQSKSLCQAQIFATDIDSASIETARSAVYPESIVADVTNERLKRFFVKDDGVFRIRKQIREMVIFAVQDVIKDPPFSKLDLISCRNMLIYMNQVLQKKIIPLFHYVLNAEGYLFLGSSETVGEFSGLFETINSRAKLFKRKGRTLARGADMPRMPFVENGVEVQMEAGRKVLTPVSVAELAKKTVLDKYTPPCAVINERNDVLYFQGNTSGYLMPPSGEPVFNIIKMAHEDLRYKLSTLIHAAFKQKKSVVGEDVPIKDKDAYRSVRITVIPVKEQTAEQELVMVVFEETAPLPRKAGKKTAKTEALPKVDSRIQTLEQELQSTREYLQTTIEELETSNEELKSTNEELQATNEELQSMNEEMETSKEELQSTNEELVTVNSELQDKVNELAKTGNDLHNMLSAIDIALIFLDSAFCIKRFTPGVTKLFKLRHSDIGRPISEITSAILDQDISMLSERVLETLRKEEIETKEKTYYVMTILPYRTGDNIIDGVVLTFVDITERKQAEGVKRLATVVRDSNDAITLQDFSGKILAWNKGAQKMYGWSEAEALEMNISETVPPEKKSEALKYIESIEAGETVESYETERITKDGRQLDVWMTITVLLDDAGKKVAVATTERDISEFRRSLGKVQELEAQIEEMKKQNSGNLK
ncbi:MAG: PAS domain S-box protein [Nitrospirae bacterium]|nr:MAG: PAS domain S-box protein [Nitrospirota bacterium]